MSKIGRAALAGKAFRGFTPEVFAVLEGLAAHQSRDWFLDNKAAYEAHVREPLGALVEALAFGFAAHDIPLTGDAKRSLFRVNRDIRFSNDKRPYKTNASAVLSRDGTKAGKGILYVQVGGPEPTAFMAAGFYGLEPPGIDALRRGVADRPDLWTETEAALTGAALALSREGALLRMPKGFEAFKDGPLAETLKLRNFTVSRPIAVERLYGAKLIDDILAFTRQAMPLLQFGWRALSPLSLVERGRG